MRSEITDRYIQMIAEMGEKMALMSPDDPKNWVRIIQKMYEFNMDNRILNNLRNQLNSSITDEKGLVSCALFRSLFFTYFKGEPHAYHIYDMLESAVSVYYDGLNFLAEGDSKMTDENKYVRISLLT
jgi:hypothetical protein